MKSARPLIFLGVEDVISLTSEDVVVQMLNAFVRGRGRSVNSAIVRELFAQDACTNLRLLQAEFNAQFVVTSAWADVLKKDELSKLLTLARLAFIVENLHRN